MGNNWCVLHAFLWKETGLGVGLDLEGSHRASSLSGGTWALEWALKPFPAVALCALGLWGIPGEGAVVNSWGAGTPALPLAVPLLTTGKRWVLFPSSSCRSLPCCWCASGCDSRPNRHFGFNFFFFFFPVLFLPPRVCELRTLFPLFHRSGVAGAGCWEGAQRAMRFIFPVGFKAQLCLAASARCCEYLLQE